MFACTVAPFSQMRCWCEVNEERKRKERERKKKKKKLVKCRERICFHLFEMNCNLYPTVSLLSVSCAWLVYGDIHLLSLSVLLWAAFSILS